MARKEDEEEPMDTEVVVVVEDVAMEVENDGVEIMEWEAEGIELVRMTGRQSEEMIVDVEEQRVAKLPSCLKSRYMPLVPPLPSEEVKDIIMTMKRGESVQVGHPPQSLGCAEECIASCDENCLCRRNGIACGKRFGCRCQPATCGNDRFVISMQERESSIMRRRAKRLIRSMLGEEPAEHDVREAPLSFKMPQFMRIQKLDGRGLVESCFDASPEEFTQELVDLFPATLDAEAEESCQPGSCLTGEAVFLGMLREATEFNLKNAESGRKESCGKFRSARPNPGIAHGGVWAFVDRNARVLGAIKRSSVQAVLLDSLEQPREKPEVVKASVQKLLDAMGELCNDSRIKKFKVRTNDVQKNDSSCGIFAIVHSRRLLDRNSMSGRKRKADADIDVELERKRLMMDIKTN